MIKKILISIFLFLISIKYAFASVPLIELDDPLKEKDLKSFLEKMIPVLTWISIFVFMFMLLYGGFTYLTASGNPEKEEKAKNTLLWAVVGIVISLLVLVIEKYFYENIKILFPL